MAAPLSDFARTLALEVKTFVTGKISPLEQRIAALEARPPSSVEWRGTYDPAESYVAGNLCTRSGSLWLAISASTGATPGRSPDHWRLVVKSGSVPQD